MRQPSRRAFLGTAAGFLGVAGCLGRDPGSTPSATTTATPPATQTPATVGAERTVDGVPVTVSNLSVQDSVLYLDSPDSMAVATREDERYVLVSVSGSESGPPPEAFSLVVDGDRYPGRVDEAGIGIDVRDRGAKYDPSFGTDSGWVAFLVPPELDAETGRVTVTDGGETAAWRLDRDVLERLRRPKARFELRETEIPEAVRRDPVTARVVAENVSEVAGTFRGVLNVAGLIAAYAPYPFALDADPGETVTWEKTFDERPPHSGTVGFFLYTVAGDRETRAPVVSGTTTETGEPSESATSTPDEHGRVRPRPHST